MPLNKKGMSWSVISKFIFALIVIAIIFVLYLNVGDFLYGTGSKAACQNWVYRNSVSYIKEFAGSLESSPCVTTEEVIKKVKDRNELYEKIARNMYDCWDQYGKGESNFYSDIDWGPSNFYCRICSEIKFDNEIKRSFKEIDIDDFEVYLSNNNPPSHKETYSDFFTKAENSKLDFGSGSISLEQNLYTMFNVYKTSDYSAGGLFNKLVLAPLSFIAVGSQIPGSGKATKAFGGLVKYTKYTTTSAPILSSGGTQIGTTTAKLGTVAKGGGWIGAAIVYVGVSGVSFLADGSIINPSLALLPSDNPDLNDICNAGVYYNPEKKPLDILKKEK